MGPETRSEKGGGVVVTVEESGKVVMGDATRVWETVHPLVDADVGFAIGSGGSKVVMLDN